MTLESLLKKCEELQADTPLPWQTKPQRQYKAILGPDGWAIAIDVFPSDADHIVSAVNNLPKLIAALRCAEYALNECIQDRETADFIAREALKEMDEIAGSQE